MHGQSPAGPNETGGKTHPPKTKDYITVLGTSFSLLFVCAPHLQPPGAGAATAAGEPNRVAAAGELDVLVRSKQRGDVRWAELLGPRERERERERERRTGPNTAERGSGW